MITLSDGDDVPHRNLGGEAIPYAPRWADIDLPPHRYVTRIWAANRVRPKRWDQSCPVIPFASDTPVGYYVVFANAPGENMELVPLIPEETFTYDDAGWAAALRRYLEIIDQADVLAMEHIL